MGKVFEALTKSGSARQRQVRDELPLGCPVGPVVSQPDILPEVRWHPAGGKSAIPHGAVRIGDFDPKLVAMNETFSVAAENFRRLRAKILHPASGVAPRSILVTSVLPSEGKGFVTANLGITMAQGVEQHALLVDCDLRRPTLAGLFGVPYETGLVSHLEEGMDLSLLIKKTGIPKLSIIPSGKPPVNPAELLDSEKMAGIIDELVNRYPDRVVILDSPPMQAASETAVLAKHVDGVVLVVRWGIAGREQVKKLAEMIGGKIIGLIFNGVQLNEVENKLYRYLGNYEYGGYHT